MHARACSRKPELTHAAPPSHPFSSALQDPDLASALEIADKAHTLPEHSYNHYTIIVREGDAGWDQVPYAVHFERELKPVLAAFDAWIADLAAMAGEEAHVDVLQAYIGYLTQYRCVCCGVGRGAGVSANAACWPAAHVAWMQCHLASTSVA